MVVNGRSSSWQSCDRSVRGFGSFSVQVGRQMISGRKQSFFPKRLLWRGKRGRNSDFFCYCILEGWWSLEPRNGCSVCEKGQSGGHNEVIKISLLFSMHSDKHKKKKASWLYHSLPPVISVGDSSISQRD